MDSQEEDGFGAYTYEPDPYELEEMLQAERLASTLDSDDSILPGTQLEINSKKDTKTSSDMKGLTPSKKAISPVDKTVSDASQSPLDFADDILITEEEAPDSGDAQASPMDQPAFGSNMPQVPKKPSPGGAKVALVNSNAVSREPLPTHKHAAENHPDPSLNAFLSQASSGTGVTSDLDMLEMRLSDLTQTIYQQNNDEEFNLNSPRQVGQVLFGPQGGSTKKEVLEGMAAGGNRMADLVLEYRSLQQEIKRATRKQETTNKGTRVKTAGTVPSSDGENDQDPLILVDASGYIFRAYYSMPPIHRSDGMPTGAVMGFCNMLNRLVLNRMLAGERPRVVLAFDAPGKTFRHDIYSQYKGNRPAAPMDLIPQFGLIREAAKAYGICQIEANHYEADDVIATLATMARDEGVSVNILSSDKDLMQLVTEDDEDVQVHMIDPVRMERITAQGVVDKWGISPSKLGDVLALAGDAADNIPGVPGIGPKIAASLIEEFGSLDNVLDNVDSVKQKARRDKLKANLEQARVSRILVELCREVPVEAMTFPDGVREVREIRTNPFDGDQLLEFYDLMGFRDLKSRIGARLKGVSAKKRSPANRFQRRPKTEIPKPEDFSDVPF